jgi:hypothetical protein
MSAAAMQPGLKRNQLQKYAEVIAPCIDDPWQFIQDAYPWGKKGSSLEDRKPHDWQKLTAKYIAKELKAMRSGKKPPGVIRVARKSGHGIGKSAFNSWIVDWCLSTMTDARCLVTANTDTQLRDKTWPEVGKWHRMSISRPYFNHAATTLRSVEGARTTSWAAAAIPWNEHNPDAFQGLHNAGRRIVIIFDEASGIPKTIWEAIEGAMTDEDTQIIWIVFGNPLRNSGRFYQCFNKFKKHWNTDTIDSRTVPGTNLLLFDEWAEMYGEDSDFYKIRVRGMWPSISAMQFIGRGIVDRAMDRRPYQHDDDPLICGIDFARNGICASVMYWRKGRDGQTIKPDVFPDDPSAEHFVAKCAARLRDMQPDLIFGDGVGVGGPIIDRLVGLGFDVIDIQSGGSAVEPDRHFNKRAEMWARGKTWIRDGGCLWKNDDFADELTTIETVPNAKSLTQLESKEHLLSRGEASPDISDAFMFTFAYDYTEEATLEVREQLGFHTSAADYNPLEGLDDKRHVNDGVYNEGTRNRSQRRRYFTGDM